MSAERASGEASVHSILERDRPQALAVASPLDFTLGPGDRVDIAEALADPSRVPYCLDPDTGSVVLVELPSDIDAAAAPFYYAEQHRSAQRVFRVPFDGFLAYCTGLPDPERLLLMHATGRCGSTLLTAALARFPGVRSVSEPDVFTQGAMAGPAADPHLRAMLAAVYRGCLRVLCRPPADLHVVKLRSIAIAHADLIGAGMTGVRRVFLYRDPVEVSRSTARILGRDPGDWTLDARERRAWRALAPLLPMAEDAKVDAYTLLAALWAGPVAEYLRLHADSGWIGSLSYEDLCADPGGALYALIERCGLPIPVPDAALAVFARDAQGGSALDRARLREASSPALRTRLYSGEFSAAVRAALHALVPEIVIDTPLPGRIHGSTQR